MASTSGSGQAAFGLGRRKKNPGLLDQIGKFFGGDKKRKGKVRKHRELRSLSALYFAFKAVWNCGTCSFRPDSSDQWIPALLFLPFLCLFLQTGRFEITD